MRLTEKCESYKNTKLYYSPVEEGIESGLDILNKLGQLEDIEDELGIDLITLFNEIKESPAYDIISGIADAVNRRIGH